MATRTFITWEHDLKQISLYKLIRKGDKTVSCPGDVRGERHSPLKAFLKPHSHPNIKFVKLETNIMFYVNHISIKKNLWDS